MGANFSAHRKLLFIAFLESVPDTLRRKAPAIDVEIDRLTKRQGRSMIVCVRNTLYAVRNLEDLAVLNPEFEAFMSAWFRPKKGDVFVDIGSHVGKYAVSAAKTVGERGLVVAVEPHPETFRALQDNAKLNQLQNLHAFNLGAWNRSGNLKFYFGGSASEFSANKTCFDTSIDVQIKRMDELLVQDLKLKHVDWVKIDVEKAEIEVLEGLRGSLFKFKPKIFIEVWSENVEKVKDFLKRLGYNLIAVSNTLGSASEWCIYFVCIPTPS